MRTELFLVRGRPSESHAAWRRWALGDLADRLSRFPAERIDLSFGVTRPPRYSLPRVDRRPVVMVVVETDADTSPVAGWLSRGRDDVQHFATETTVPMERPRAAAGGRYSGVTLLTVFDRRPGLDDATFLERWHGEHSPMASAIHPFAGYARHHVQATYRGSGRDAIVEEVFDAGRDVLCPTRFFGGCLRALPNALRIGRHVQTFLNLDTLENHLLRTVRVR